MTDTTVDYEFATSIEMKGANDSAVGVFEVTSKISPVGGKRGVSEDAVQSWSTTVVGLANDLAIFFGGLPYTEVPFGEPLVAGMPFDINGINVDLRIKLSLNHEVDGSSVSQSDRSAIQQLVYETYFVILVGLTSSIMDCPCAVCFYEDVVKVSGHEDEGLCAYVSEIANRIDVIIVTIPDSRPPVASDEFAGSPMWEPYGPFSGEYEDMEEEGEF